MMTANPTLSMILMYSGSGIYLLALIIGILLAVISKAHSNAKTWFIIGCSLLIFSTLLTVVFNSFVANFLSSDQMVFAIAISSVIRGVILSGSIFAFGYAALGKHSTKANKIDSSYLPQPTNLRPDDSNNPYR